MTMRSPVAAWLLCALACSQAPSDLKDSGGDGDTGEHPPDARPAPDADSGPRMLIFATSSKQNGDLGGFEGADAICNDLADAAGLAGTFMAWISSPEESAEERLDHSAKPYARVDGARIADDWDDLVDGELDSPISLDESGIPVFGDVWTGTLASGVPADATCGGFATSDETGVCGDSNAVDGRWTDRTQPSCTAALRLYCVQQ